MADYYGGWKDPKTEKWNRKTNDASMPPPAFKYVGVTGLGADGAPDKPEKVSGTGIFCRDVALPGMLFAKTLTSPYANAKITKMDTTKAAALPGVRCVLRYDDPEWGEALRAGGSNAHIPGEANHEGQRVGVAIAADTEQIVDAALKLVEIQWEELPFLLDWDNPPADKVLFDKVTEEHGDVEAGFKEADKVVEVKIKKNNTVWAGVEGQVATANFRGDRYLDVWVHAQIPQNTQYTLSTWFPECRTHLNAPYHGSEFGSLNWGGYFDRFPLTACVLAKKALQPVKHLYDGSEFDGGSQIDGTYQFKVGMKNDGTITAVDVVNPCSPTFGRAGSGSGGLWNWEVLKTKNTRYRIVNANVNLGLKPCWKHGGGYCFITAMPLAIVAEELKMNPIDVIMLNNGSCGEDWEWVKDYMAEYGFDPNRDSAKECLDALNKTIDMRNNWHAAGTKILPNGKYHGIGFSYSQQWTHVLGDKGGSNIGLALRADGTLTIMALRGDQGTGFQGAWVRVAADEMGMLLKDVDCVGIHDTEFFHAHDEGCSGGTISNAMSIIKAARKLKQWVLEAATFDETSYVVTSHGSIYTGVKSLFADKKPEEMDIKDSVVFEKANPDNKKTLKEVVRTVDTGAFGGEFRRLLFDWGWSRNIDPVLNPDDFSHLHGWPCMTRAIEFMEVEVDPETGKVDVVKGAAAGDTGVAFYPEGCAQQIFGGFIMGYSRAGLEELFFDPQTGVHLNDNLIGYPVAVMNDCAHPVASIIETGCGYGPYGSAGCGETSAANAQSLIPIAVYNAIGKWVDNPATPDRILKALGKI